MRVAGEAIARQAGIENGDLASGTAELQGAGETGKAAADDDDVIHGDGLRVVDGRDRRSPHPRSSRDVSDGSKSVLIASSMALRRASMAALNFFRLWRR